MQISHEESALREDLAAAFRLAARFDWSESVANHFSAVVPGDERKILLNPRWQHFTTVKPGDLLKLDVDDPDVMQQKDAPDPSAWCIHGAIHAEVENAKVLLHCHPPYATALCSLADPAIKPIDQNTARFFGNTVIDLGFDGIADQPDEGARLAKALGDHRVMLMGNHGVSVVAPTVARAFDDLYYLEKACRTMVLAYSTGQPLNVMSDDLAGKTAAAWEEYSAMGDAHFEHLKKELDSADPQWRQIAA